MWRSEVAMNIRTFFFCSAITASVVFAAPGPVRWESADKKGAPIAFEKIDTASLALPSEAFDTPRVVLGDDGAFAVAAGPGESYRGVVCSAGKLAEGEEFILPIRRIEAKATGWVSITVVLVNAKKQSIGFNLAPNLGFISSWTPAFRNLTGTFKFDAGVMLKLRRTSNTIAFFKNNEPFFQTNNDAGSVFDTVQVTVSMQKNDSAVLIEAAPAEIRALPAPVREWMPNYYDPSQAKYWPFIMPSKETLRASKRKLFAGYHSPFPVSINNKPEEHEYYVRPWADPFAKEGPKSHAAYGGYLREKPYYRLPKEGSWKVSDYEDEIRLAMAAGIDGFIYNIVSTSGNYWDMLLAVFEAAKNVSPDFKIVIMPDCACEFKNKDIATMVKVVGAFRDHPNVMRHNGKIVLAPWGAQRLTPEYWADVLKALDAAGTPVSFMPCTHGFWGDSKYAAFTGDGTYLDAVKHLCEGLMDSAVCCSLTQSLGNREVPKQVHDANIPVWVQTVRAQDPRAHAAVTWEANNSALYRETWDIAIKEGGPNDWVQIFCWNDQQESHTRPCTGTQYAWYDLGAFYGAWFKTGSMPRITNDAFYYTHRLHRNSAQYDAALQTIGKFKFHGSNAPSENIEMLAMLTAPATLAIEIDGKRFTTNAPAGVTSFLAPLAEGTSEFKIERGGRTFVHTRSKWTVSDTIVYETPHYFAGSSTRERNLAEGDAFPKKPLINLRCNETWGPYLYDCSGNNFHGKKNNFSDIRPVTGRENNGVCFVPMNTSNAIVTSMDKALRALSIAAWISPDTTPKGVIAEQRDGSAGYSLFCENGEIVFRAGNGPTAIAARCEVPARRWAFVCATFDGVHARIYIDGRPAAGGDVTGYVPAATGLTIGRKYEGRIDELSIFERVLTQVEIDAIYAYPPVMQ